MVVQTQFLDLWQLFLVDITGTDTTGVSVFIALSFVMIAYAAAILRFPTAVTMAMFTVYAIIIAAFFPIVLAITLFVVGIMFAWSLSRMVSRG